ncbi:MAG TPA: hypothetical protein VGM88_06935 [Kofleriaceae bacterium]|jgi:hypothetical protein
MHRSLLLVLLLAACGSTLAPYRYESHGAGALVTDANAFDAFARDLRTWIGRDLAQRPPSAHVVIDRFLLAMLDALVDDWHGADVELARARAAERDPQARIMLGLTIRVWVDARAHLGATPEAFGIALDRAVTALPPSVRGELEMLRTMAEVFSPDTCRSLTDQAVPHTALSLDDAAIVVFQRYAVVELVPVAAVIDATLESRGIGAKH